MDPEAASHVDVKITASETEAESSSAAANGAIETLPSATPKALKESIRKAFETDDPDLTIAAHVAKAKLGADEKHGGLGSDRIKSIVFGGLDGVVSTFSAATAIAGAGLSIELVLLSALASLFADGISMGFGDAISSSSELQFVKNERKREAWEFSHCKEAEVEEMIELYKKQGVSEEDARAILEKMAKYPDLFIDHMMVMELGHMTPDKDDNPAKDGLWTFLSFILFGSVPILSYLFCWAAKYSNKQGAFGISCAATAITLFCLGAVQGKISRLNVWKSGSLMLLNGGMATVAAYLIGWGLEEAFGLSQKQC